ncbi:MAG: prephenate dehydrogenase [Acidithiobacillales bacterium SG8_45]|jgi:prephenate dehydrogenase|nr:MAG: prephenate dehydrogenase [Acidithiobacillales bacterium SG8_45]
MINKLAIIGIGLIGGSLARALRRAGHVKEVVGFGRNLNNLKLAVDLGVVDHAEVNLAAAIEDADMIVLAVPVGAMTEVFSRLAGRITRETVVTDVGSVKTSVVAMAREALGAEEFSRFVPGHPIAGTEQSGVAASREDLFQNHQIILSPEPDTDPGALETVRAMWEAAGATVRLIDAPQHDIVLAASSHLPHVLAYALVDMLVRRDDHREIFDLAAGGFRDFTRIASSDPTMWRDICVANREPLLKLLQNFSDDLGEVMAAIEAGNGEWLMNTFERARHARETYVKPAPSDSPDSVE